MKVRSEFGSRCRRLGAIRGGALNFDEVRSSWSVMSEQSREVTENKMGRLKNVGEVIVFNVGFVLEKHGREEMCCVGVFEPGVVPGAASSGKRSCYCDVRWRRRV